MSYILEALKKAQAERQLGNAPTIHAPTLHAVPVKLQAVKKSGVLALACGAAVLVAAGAFVWHQRAPAPVVIPATATASLPAAVPAIAASPVLTPAPAPAPVPAPAMAPAPVAAPAQATPVARPRTAPVVAAPIAVSPPADVPAAALEDTVRYAKDLPQDIQQQLPRVGFGGYMYSDNPADRLVLVDKTLRHEGEEIAPGLLLEKLLPKGAVLNYRGTRYRVGF